MLALATAAGAATPSVSPVLNPPPEPDPLLWPEPQRAFFQDGPGLLLTETQRAEFLASDEDGRDAFIRKFLSDPDRSTPDNELRQAIARRQRLAAREFPSPLDPRAQLLFLNGPPAARKVLDCGATFRPIEIWTYGQPPADHSLILYRPASGEPFQVWLAIDSKRALYAPEMEAALEDLARMGEEDVRIDRRLCPDSREVDRVTGIDGLSPRPGKGREEELARVSIGGGEDNRPSRVFRWITPQNRVWSLERPRDLAAWMRQAVATELPSDEPPGLEVGAVEVDFPRRQEQRVAVRALVPVAGDSLQVATDGRKPEVRLTVSLIVEHAGRVFEELRVRYHLPPPPKGQSVPLVFERQLRPDQTFLLRLKVRDDVSGAETWVARGFAVPSQPVARLGDVARTAPRGEILLPSDLAGKDRLMLPPPPDEVVLSVWRAEPLIDGDRIVKVVFLVDGKEQVSRTRPPFSAEVRLATFPKEQTVRVEGYDQNNELVAFDEVTLNRARGAFQVKIVDPKENTPASGKVKARAEVATPDDRRVESVEWRLNDAPIATLTAPPWETTVQIPAAEPIVYLTVVATLDDGSRAEETHFLRAPENFEQVEVHLVELYTAVADGSGRPVQGLTADDFEVLEAGKRQTLTKFERVQNLPLNVGLVLDASTSMASSLSEAQRAAAGFLENMVTPRDRCFALGFSTRPFLLMAPVNDAEAVGRSLDGLQAIGSTALYDAVLTSLYYFRGFQGQRAMILLSDGEDTSSHTPFERVLEFAQRSGVAIYPIGLGIGALNLDARSKLVQLAEATGGQTFFIDRADQLAGVYDQLEDELRGRYLLAYQTERGEEAGFRPVEVRVKKRGLKARTVRGYYP